ncbi:Short chain oxidoreductase [Rhizobium sp. Leaf306]|uniref:SDR family oxidoreductase n=1 Tax=unclassified Rhizobium TaxID=2613769 RepID=UPI000715146B|nr:MULTISPECIES: SDR family oxidoreductase [unclassified Rhizobium]KQQ32848.1 Short chain oxidoreductase [Rhizobium sp. Leaf306]MBD8665638.1 SDR family oxidoreductase [Rhizobium sp. CFBP 8752]
MSQKVIVVTGAGSGIGRAIAETLAIAGHIVYASMRSLKERNQERVEQMSLFAAEKQVDLRALELDVLSEESIRAAFDQVLLETGRLDVVVNNAGMLMVGIAEAFTPAQMARILDTNAISWLRVNRAALPIMRRQKEGILVYVGSTTSRIHEPFIGPYIASKAAGEALAEAMRFEAAPFGIESVIVVPGAFTSGTEHFADAHGPESLAVVSQYGELPDRLGGLGTALEVLDAEKGLGLTVESVGKAVKGVLDLPFGEKPFRISIDPQGKGTDEIEALIGARQLSFFEGLGIADLMKPERP